MRDSRVPRRLAVRQPVTQTPSKAVFGSFGLRTFLSPLRKRHIF
jgi:hypothetical protein